MSIAAGEVIVPGPVKISDDAEMWASDKVEIGEYTNILPGFEARCRSLHIGKHCRIHKNVHIGGGGCMGPNAHVWIGDYVGIYQNTTINCAEQVHIGDYVGIGQEVKIWTHGTWLPVAEGFPPQQQGSVRIGNKVWLPARCQVLAGVTIGDNVVVGINSLVNKDLPGGCFAAGMPAKVLKENAYPNHLDDTTLLRVAADLCAEYRTIAHDKGFDPHVVAKINVDVIHPGVYVWFQYMDEFIEFDLRHPELTKLHDISEYAEDFRDFLRRNGLKFYNGGFFRSMLPLRFAT